MALLSQFERYEGYIFTECSLLYEGWFYVENSKSQKKKNIYIYIISLFFYLLVTKHSYFSQPPVI